LLHGISDLVDGLIRLMNSNFSQPVNLGNPEEHTILDFAKLVQKYSGMCLVYQARPSLTLKENLEDRPCRCY